MQKRKFLLKNKRGLKLPFQIFSIPKISFTWQTFMILLPLALILASIGLIESLMTLSLIDEMTQTRGRGNKECVGQGLANITTGFFGGMGGCAMIGPKHDKYQVWRSRKTFGDKCGSFSLYLYNLSATIY